MIVMLRHIKSSLFRHGMNNVIIVACGRIIEFLPQIMLDFAVMLDLPKLVIPDHLFPQALELMHA